jgi:hypothetical protein
MLLPFMFFGLVAAAATWVLWTIVPAAVDVARAAFLARRPDAIVFTSLQRLAVLAHGSFIFRGRFWCLVLIAQAVASWKRERTGSLRFWVALSGLCYLFGFFPVGQGCDFRFLYWPIVACFASAAAPDRCLSGGYFPARRAASVDPSVTLRGD